MARFNIYSKLLPKMGYFGKFDLPMTYNRFKTKDVVLKTRKPGYCTIFDVSHMGVLETKNRELIEKKFLVNMDKYQNKSKLCCYLDDKYIIDDLIIGDIDNSKYRLVVNGNTKNLYPEFEEKNKIILAVQGDYSQQLLENLLNIDLQKLYFMENMTVVRNELEISRCGYTGEDGFELYMEPKIGEFITQKLIDLSLNNHNILFGGLIERDLLRLEAGLCLSGKEFSPDMNIDFKSLNMNFMIDPNYRKKTNFINNFKLMGFIDNRPIREGELLNIYNDKIGFITSSNKSFNLNKFIALGYINKNIDCDILKGNIIKTSLPFITPKYFKN
jgi:aminomethyltransferase